MAVTGEASDLLISRIGQLSRLSAQVIDEELKPLGISYQEMRIVGLLMGESGITQKALAKKLSVRPATLSVAITRLEQQGLVTRRLSSEDKRVQYLTLKSNKKISTVDSRLQKLESEMCNDIPAKDLKVAKAVIGKLINNLYATLNHSKE
mgnify:FL=1